MHQILRVDCKQSSKETYNIIKKYPSGYYLRQLKCVSKSWMSGLARYNRFVKH